MEFFRCAAVIPQTLGIFPGTFNPPTRAHLALARSALSYVDEVTFVLPRVFPHKRYEGASFGERIEMLELALGIEGRFSIASTQKGLFIEVARECRQAYGPGTRLMVLCGRDAAERIMGWDYGGAGTIEQMLDEFELLVASRSGSYQPPEHLAARIHPLPIDEDPVSASEVRARIERGDRWEELVPATVRERAREIYRSRREV